MRRHLAQGRREPIYDWQLTDAELAIAKGLTQLPRSLQDDLAEQPGTLLARTTAMRKLRAYMEEERRLGDEIAAYEGYKDLADKTERLADENASLRVEVDAAKRENTSLRTRLQQATAQPALAAHSGPTGQ